MDYISADAMSQCAKRALEGAEQTIPGHGRVPVGLEKLIR
jgi:hypothetical protein